MKPTSFGLEKEFFVKDKDGNFKVVDHNMDLPYDDCRLLVEARSKPDKDPIQAVYNLGAEIHGLTLKAKKLGLTLHDDPIVSIPRETIIAAARIANKGPVEYQNLYGHVEIPKERDQRTAGIHISFVCTQEIKYTKHTLTQRTASLTRPKEVTDLIVNLLETQPTVTSEEIVHKYSPLWDYIQLFRFLDQRFEAEIKEAGRLPGFYELKHDGRIEYRSLPANADLTKIATALQEYLSK